METYCNKNVSNEILELLNQQIIEVLDKARKYIEELKREIPFS